MALIVLGAGATRGASFVTQPGYGCCLPPLDSDFFTQAQRIATDKHAATVDRLIRDAVSLFGSNFKTTLETMFTVIEHTSRMLRATSKPVRKRFDLLAMRTNLLQAVAAVLEESLVAKGVGPYACAYHEALVRSLRPKDTILTFNYDCVIDYALASKGDKKWNARFGYCLPLPRGRSGSIGEFIWNPDEPASKADTIHLLKLHGSVHFSAKSGGLFRLKARPYARLNGDLRFEIIPPEWNKKWDEGVFGKLWARASEEIHRAKTIVVVGYSFPTTDLHTSALFRVSVAKGLNNVVVVNPDGAARRRTVDVLRHGLEPGTRILVFDTFQQFAGVRRSLWDRPPGNPDSKKPH